MHKEKEEVDPLFYHLPLSRVLNWNRWWYILAKTVQIVLRKKKWAAIGTFLQGKTRLFTPGIIRLRLLWNQESLELKRLKHLSDEELKCPSPHP